MKALSLLVGLALVALLTYLGVSNSPHYSQKPAVPVYNSAVIAVTGQPCSQPGLTALTADGLTTDPPTWDYCGATTPGHYVWQASAVASPAG